MNIEIAFLESLSKKEEGEVWKILCECDKDFIPPLSSRESSYQIDNLDAEKHDEVKPVSYFKEMIKQLFIVAKYKGKMIGFLSFKHNYESEEISEFTPSNYSTTTCIDKNYRNKGVGRALYEYLENNLDIKYRLPYITRRTWSTNYNQIYLFNKIGYEEVFRIKDHRGAGVDTVYFAKKIL